MKVAIIGSRGITDISYDVICDNMPLGCTEIVSGGAIGVDTQAARYAKKNNIKLTTFLPDYEKFDRVAPIIRNAEIVHNADYVLIIWDGKSKGSHNVIMTCLKTNKPFKLYVLD